MNRILATLMVICIAPTTLAQSFNPSCSNEAKKCCFRLDELVNSNPFIIPIHYSTDPVWIQGIGLDVPDSLDAKVIDGMYEYGKNDKRSIKNSGLLSYCIPVCTNSGSSGAKIESFYINTLRNCRSGQGATSYTHYPDSIYTTTLEMGKAYYMLVSKGTFSGLSIGVRVYLDFNNDKVFGANERILSTDDPVSNTLIPIPFDSAFVGKRRLRVFSTAWGLPANPCASFYIGEVEDYDVTIAFPTPDTLVINPNQWENTFVKVGYQVATKIVETYDKGYLICGSNGNNPNVYLLKTTVDGNILSDKTHIWSGYFYASGLHETTDGGYVVAGGTGYGSNAGGIGFIRKFTPCGNPTWLQLYGDPNNYGYLREVYQTPDSGYIASGSYLFSNVTNYIGRVCLLRTDKSGNQLWLKDFTCTMGSDVASFIPTQDNGSLITLYGYTPNPGDTTGYYWVRGVLTKVDSLGNLEWNLVLDTLNMESALQTSIELSDQSILSAGTCRDSITAEIKPALFKVSQDGKLMSYRVYENSGFYISLPKVIRKIDDNKYFLLCRDINNCDPGSYFPNTSVMLIDSSLNILARKQLSLASIIPSDAIINSNGEIVVVGTKVLVNLDDIYLATLNPDNLAFDTLSYIILNYDSLCDPSEGIPISSQGIHQVVVRPNPADDVVTVDAVNYNNLINAIEMYNATGDMVKTLGNIQNQQVTITLTDLPQGIYFIRIFFADGTHGHRKLIRI